MKNKKRAQGVIEFMVIFGSILFFFILFFGVIQSNIEKKNAEKEATITQSVALGIKEEIKIAAGSSEGYFREFKTPLNILGRDYSINITNNFIYVSTENTGFSYKIPEVNGEIKKGVNNISKQNGTVYLNA